MQAHLLITQTSPTCCRYRLVNELGTVIWQNRVEPSDRGHAGARSRMASWALRHKVTIVDRVPTSQRQAMKRAG